MLHALKTIQPYFNDVASEDKPFEVRKADRPFAVGDYLALNEWNGESYTGRFLLAYVIYILDTPEYVKEGYVILGIAPASIFSFEQPYEFNRTGKGYQVYGNGEKNCRVMTDCKIIQIDTI